MRILSVDIKIIKLHASHFRRYSGFLLLITHTKPVSLVIEFNALLKYVEQGCFNSVADFITGNEHSESYPEYSVYAPIASFDSIREIIPTEIIDQKQTHTNI